MSNLSPRRVKPAPAVVMYELRVLRTSLAPAALLPLFEARARTWRGVARWGIQCSTSARGEVVLRVAVERHSLARLDNHFATWRRALRKALGRALDARALRRGEWAAVGDASVLADVRVLFDAFDAACAKLWAEAHDPLAVRCSYLEPALPALLRGSNGVGARAPPPAAAAKAAVSAHGHSGSPAGSAATSLAQPVPVGQRLQAGADLRPSDAPHIRVALGGERGG